MSEMITVRLNNFLFNAGVVGFVYMLENCKIPKELYRIEGSELHIAQELFIDKRYDLSQLYFLALRSRFENDTAWNRLKNLKDEIEHLDLSTEEGRKKFDQIIIDDSDKTKKFGRFKRLEDSSYKAGYEIIKQQPYNNQYDVLTEWKNVKKEKDQEAQRKKLLEILHYIINYPEVFCYKDIAYTKINKIWNDDPKVFLFTKYRTRDMIQVYREKFISPIKEFLNSSIKGKDQCIECGTSIIKDIAMGLTWLKMGVDHKRKKSYFWNFIPDSFLCPICSFIYSCAPLGFTFATGRSDAVFVNNNASITDLIQDNKLTDLNLDKKKSAGEICFYLVSELIQKSMRLKEREIDNIQVIIRYNKAYDIGIISKEKLEILKIDHCRSSFERLIPIYIKIGKNEYLSVYREVLRNFLANINQYLLIDKILRSEERFWYVWHVLRIQIYSKGGMKSMIKYFDAKKSRDCGLALRAIMAGKNDEQTDNKIRGLTYQLLNALQVRDINRFMDIICRVYTGFGKEIPAIFLQMFDNRDEDTFRNLGYAFILGLKGEDDQKEDNKDAYTNENNEDELFELKEEVSNEN